MKKYFTTGLAILLPIFLTVTIIAFLINFVTNPFLGTVEEIFKHFNHPSFFLTETEQLRFFSKLIILSGILCFILVVGFLGRLFLIEYLFTVGDKIIHRVPIVNKIYKACKDVVHGLFSSESSSFSQVVFVPFPTIDTLSMGLITRDSILLHASPNKTDEVVPVFIPGTPNPSVGFMLMFKREELIFIDMKVEDAMKFIVSCGVVSTEFTIKSYDETK